MAKNTTPTAYANKSLSELSYIIRKDWGSKTYFGAAPYLDAMMCLEKVSDNYGLDSGKSIVTYFLCNATTWRGDVAREVKKELNSRIK